MACALNPSSSMLEPVHVSFSPHFLPRGRSSRHERHKGGGGVNSVKAARLGGAARCAKAADAVRARAREPLGGWGSLQVLDPIHILAERE